jgi:ParB family transcriptional regulator, chromosome partitioning protein
MHRDLHHIPLADLHLSKLNVRRHGAKEIDSLAASIAALGLIQPLVVRNGRDGFEIVAGQRRYLAVKKLNADGAPETDTVPCVVMDASDDAAALEASLAENIARLPMDEMDQFEAFAALKKNGLDEADIAAHFAISRQIVKRRLAIAGLHPDIRRLYRAGDIDAKTLHLLTLATKDRQKAWLALHRDPEQTPPPAWQLRAWLLGGVEIATTTALFDEALYQGGIVSDLFGEDRYFTDPDEFWRLQNVAIAAEADRYRAAGWPEVIVIAPDERFQPWDYDRASKAKGGAVYIDVDADGQVTVHKGLALRHCRRMANSGIAREGDADAAHPVRAELSMPLANYIELLRHSAVRLAVADAPGVALRLMLAHVVGGGRWWQVAPEPQRPATPLIGDAIAALPSEAAFKERRQSVAEQLAIAEVEGAIVDRPIVEGESAGARTADVFARLCELSDTDVMHILAVVMAETLAAGTTLIDTLGETLKVDLGHHWTPDETFFSLVKDRETVSAMLAEVIGTSAAKCTLTETATKKKAIIRKALAGKAQSKVEGWIPRTLAFPQHGYTQRPLTAHTRPAA